jgi:hypothetical protein
MYGLCDVRRGGNDISNLTHGEGLGPEFIWNIYGLIQCMLTKISGRIVTRCASASAVYVLALKAERWGNPLNNPGATPVLHHESPMAHMGGHT